MATGVSGNVWSLGRRWSVVVQLALAACLTTQVSAAQTDEVLYGDESNETTGTDESSADGFSEQAEETEESAPQEETNELGLTEEELGGACLPSCEPGTTCRDGKCISLCDPACPLGEVCTGQGICTRLGGVHARMEEGAEKRKQQERDEQLIGIRGFGGLVLGGGMSVFARKLRNRDKLDDPVPSGALYFALKGGVMMEQIEFSVEWAPGTFYPEAGNIDERGVVDKNEWVGSLLGNLGFHLPFTDRIYWPLRIGAGVIPAGGRWDFQGRVDLVNLSIKTKYLLIETSVPSVRYTSDFDDWHRWTALVLVGASYISP